jgi:hypothetical protein
MLCIVDAEHFMGFATIKDAVYYVDTLHVCPPLSGEVNGSGPCGVIEVSDRVKALGRFLRYSLTYPHGKRTLINEFVWDPLNLRFAIHVAPARQNPHGGSPHQRLARAIEADEKYVCGGIVHGGGPGVTIDQLDPIETSEFSGHYWTHWDDDIRRQFQRYMYLRTGRNFRHREGI